MIIILANEGQMCNQLLTLASAYSLGLEYKESVKCPIMSEKLKDSFMFQNNEAISVQMYESKYWKIIATIIKAYRKFLHIKGKEHYNQGKNNHVFTDWISMKDDIVFAKHQVEIRHFFKIKTEIEQKCSEKIEKLRCDNKILVGVHVRRGDYKSFHDGEWYYSNAEYLRWMKGLTDKKVRFVLFSNEPIDIDEFIENGIDTIRLSGNAVEDLCCLSMCDYIMGPPSTYSWWAAMYGDKKRLILESRTESYSWNDFMYLSDRAHLGIDKY